MKFCVTGATGLLGNNLCRILIEQRHEVRVNVRVESDRAPIMDLDVEVHEGDLNSPEFVNELLDGVDGVFHAAALIWLGKSRLDESIRTNVDATYLIAKACLERSIRMVHVSTTDALAAGQRDHPANEQDIDPAKCDSNYVVSKRKAESRLLKMHAEDNLDVVIVNPGLLLGPWDWKPSTGQMILAVANGFLPLAPGGGISVADVREVSKAMITAWKKGAAGERYILAGENISYLELWRRIARLAGRQGPLASMPPLLARMIGWGGDVIANLFGETHINSRELAIGQMYNYYDSSRAINELDYNPGSMDQSLHDQWVWLQNHGYTRRRASQFAPSDELATN